MHLQVGVSLLLLFDFSAYSPPHTKTVEFLPLVRYNISSKHAGVAQLLERFLAKEEVES